MRFAALSDISSGRSLTRRGRGPSTALTSRFTLKGIAGLHPSRFVPITNEHMSAYPQARQLHMSRAISATGLAEAVVIRNGRASTPSLLGFSPQITVPGLQAWCQPQEITAVRHRLKSRFRHFGPKVLSTTTTRRDSINMPLPSCQLEAQRPLLRRFPAGPQASISRWYSEMSLRLAWTPSSTSR